MIGETLYIGSDEGTLFALDTANGRNRWTYDAGAHDQGQPQLRARQDLLR